LLLVPAIFGVDEGTKTLARDLASGGAHVWVVDPFWRTSPGVIARDEEGFKKGIARARNVDEELATADFADLIRAMGQEEGCNGKVVVLGICFAGKFALRLTSQGHAAAGASFHGARMTPLAGLAEQISAPLSLHFGDQDVAIPVEDVAVLREAFKGHDNVEIFLHEGGVKHGFGDPGSDGFDPAVYKKALAAVQGLLDGLR
jgi:carboxymethylenebutenolidase